MCLVGLSTEPCASLLFVQFGNNIFVHMVQEIEVTPKAPGKK